jgi:thiaminase
MESNLLQIFKLTNPKPARWNTYRDCIVIAKTAEKVKYIHPNSQVKPYSKWWELKDNSRVREWCHPDEVLIEHIGFATGKYKVGQVICASFLDG